MSTVTLFVDDAVQGHVPMVCVVTGAPADGVHRVEQSIGPPAWVFVLLLLGPIGWIALVAIQACSTSLTVRLPKTVAAVDRETRGPLGDPRCRRDVRRRDGFDRARRPVAALADR